MKAFVIVENYRNEKNGDSIEQVQIIDVYLSEEKANERLQELHKEAINVAKQFFSEDDIHTEIGKYGSECYLEYEYDTFHLDYTVSEKDIIE